MKQIRLLIGLLGVLFFVTQTQAAPVVGVVSGLDLLKHENFSKLTLEEKVIVAITLRHAMADAEREAGGDADMAQIDQRLFSSPIWELVLPLAQAAESNRNLCFGNGVARKKENGVCPDIPQGNCPATQRLCEPTLYGPHICAVIDTNQCEQSMQRPHADDAVADYLRDPKHQQDFEINAMVIGQACNEAQKPTQTCNFLVARMRTAVNVLESRRSVAQSAPAPAPLVKGALQVPKTDMPLAQIPPPAAPPVALRAAKPDQLNADQQAARDEIKSETEGASFGKCDQWKLAESISPYSDKSAHGMLMTFQQAQQMVCEHRPFTDDEWKDIEGNLASRLSEITYKSKKGGGYECKTKSRASEMGVKCEWMIGLEKNLEACKAEMFKRPVDTKWASAVRAIPGVEIKQAQYTTAEAYNNPDGMAPVQLQFNASYKNIKVVQDDHFNAQKNHSEIINGKYVSRSLAVYKVPICDVRRNEAGFGPGAAPGQRRHEGRPTVTDSNEPSTSRQPASVQGVDTIEAAPGADNGWVMPSLPQGMPGSGGGSGHGHTSGQGH